MRHVITRKLTPPVVLHGVGANAPLFAIGDVDAIWLLTRSSSHHSRSGNDANAADDSATSPFICRQTKYLAYSNSDDIDVKIIERRYKPFRQPTNANARPQWKADTFFRRYAK